MFHKSEMLKNAVSDRWCSDSSLSIGEHFKRGAIFFPHYFDCIFIDRHFKVKHQILTCNISYVQ